MQHEAEQARSIQHWNQCLEAVAKSGDRKRFMELYDHFAPRLNAWLTGVTRDAALAEELTQETLLTVWRKSALYDSRKAAASTWIFRIARNLHVDHLRRQQVRDKAACYLENPESGETDAALDNDRVRAAMRQLPVQQAQVVYKSYFEGKSHQEIADDMSLALGSVKSSLRLAFQKLRDTMRPLDEH